ncbi:hypothetical protein FEDK69T_12110 [Flavobacterium enshiense DK69]|nr:hypothetical protein FEDK69T_12110 [Flavobacterium enshiense DK69]
MFQKITGQKISWPLRNVFEDLEGFIKYWENDDDYESLISKYKVLNLKNEKEVLEWLLEGECLTKDELFFSLIDYHTEEKYVLDGKIILSKEFDLKIELNDFKLQIEFFNLYYPLYYFYLDKYECEFKEIVRNMNQSFRNRDFLSDWATVNLDKIREAGYEVGIAEDTDSENNNVPF